MSRRSLLWLLIAFVWLAPVARAHAQSPEDTIVLRDGTVLRGHVAEMRPGEMVTIVLLTGQSRVIAWEQIARSFGPSFPGSEPQPGNVQAQDEDYKHPGPGKVPVRVQSSTERQLDVGIVEGAISAGYIALVYGQRVCLTPCTVFVRPGEVTLHTGGEGLVPVNTSLQVPPGGLDLKFKPASRWGRAGGIMLISLGGALVVAGGTMMGLAAMDTTFNLDGTTSTSMNTGLMAGGGGVLAGGIGLVVGGIVLVVKNRGGLVEERPLDPNAQPASFQVKLAPQGLKLVF